MRRHAGRPGRKKHLPLCTTTITVRGQITNGCGRRHVGNCRRELGRCSCGARFYTRDQMIEHDHVCPELAEAGR